MADFSCVTRVSCFAFQQEASAYWICCRSNCIFLFSVEILSAGEVLRAVDSGSQIISTVAGTVIGFLVAGLTIFTTLSDRKILVVMADTPQMGMQVSCFKYLFYNLLNVFVVYIFALCSSSLIQVCAKVEMQIADLQASGIIFPSALIINSLAVSFLSALAFESILTLKNFIWNIYSTFLSVLTVSALMDETD